MRVSSADWTIEGSGISMEVIIVRDRASAGGGIYNYYQSVSRHLGMRHRLIDVGRPHNYYGVTSHGWFGSMPTPVRLVLDWMSLVVNLIRSRGIVHLNVCLDPVEMRSLKRDAVNLFLAKIFRRPVIVFWRGWDNDACGTPEFPCGNRGWMSRIYRWADAHIVLAGDFRDDLRRWGFTGPIYLETTVVADTILDTRRELNSAQSPGVFRLLYLSRVELEKGVLELLDALAVLNERKPGYYQLKVAGDGPGLEILKRRSSDLGLSNVVFTGYVEGTQRSDCYADADAFCFLSYNEGMPNAVLEAMAMGLPLVTSMAGGLKDILQDGVTGYLPAYDRSADPGCRFSPEEVANLIERLAAEPETRQSMAAHNRSYARERFAAKQVAARLEAIYRAVLDQRI